MKCSECGGKMSARRENYLFAAESGLPVTLAAVEVWKCATCGVREASVPALPELNAAIIGVLVRKPGRLAGAEFRFLRSVLGLSGVELARLMGATPNSVSRWEGGAAPVGVQADKLLRLLAARGVNIGNYSLAEIEMAASRHTATPMRFTMTRAGGAWRMADTSGRRKAA